MKEVMAIVRPNLSVKTRERLAELGFYGFTGRNVNGKGKEPVDVQLGGGLVAKSRMLPKRMILVVVEDDEVEQVVQAIMEVNSTNAQGDGKIFINPIVRAYTISSGRCFQ